MKNIIIAFALVLFSACSSKDVSKDFTVENDLDIQTYTPGTGTQPTTRDNVTVAYKGYFSDGTVFDQSDTNGISFSLQQVIAGRTEGITYFKEGGSGILLIPSSLGYGNKGRSSIPGGAVLIFDIALISIN